MHRPNRMGLTYIASLVLLTLATLPAMAATWTVPTGGSLQSVINNAQLGDTILVAAGATFTGPFTLPAKTGTGWLTIRTSTPDTALPAANARISPAYASLLPNLVSPGANQPVVQTAPGANHYILLGLECLPANPQAVVSTLVTLGDGSSAQNSLDQVPHDLVLDRCYIHGLPGVELKRGVGLNSASTQILNCYISDCKGVGYDTQAICGWNGPGPFTITNNYLEGAGENVMFGGADPSIPGLIPSDITIQNNYFSKPLSWRVGAPSYGGIHWTVKNLFEIKNAQRVVINDNLFENSWADGQVGFAISLKSANQNGSATWSTCSDVQFTNNTVRHAACGVNIAGSSGPYPSTPVERISISNNLFDDINGAAWGGAGTFIQSTDADTLTVNHNTVFQSGDILVAYGTTHVTNFVFTNNIVPHNTYGVKGDGTRTGSATLAKYFPGCTFASNLIEGSTASASLYPTGNAWPVAWSNIGFTDIAHYVYTLAGTSPYRSTATDGSDPGCIYGYATDFTLNPASTTIAGASLGMLNAPRAMSSLRGRQPLVDSGADNTGWITFNGQAPPGSAPITLVSSDPSIVTVPASITVAPGVTSISFPINTVPVTSNRKVTITAKWHGVNRATTVAITPMLKYLNTSSNVVGGTETTAIIYLNVPAPAGGVKIDVSSNNPSVTVPTTVSIAAGMQSVQFQVSTSLVASDVSATITARYAGVISSSSLVVRAPTFTYIGLSTAKAHGGTSCTGAVTMNMAAPAGGTTILLSSNNAGCTVPVSVLIPQGAKTAMFSVFSRRVAASTRVTITGICHGVSLTTILTLTP